MPLPFDINPGFLDPLTLTGEPTPGTAMPPVTAPGQSPPLPGMTGQVNVPVRTTAQEPVVPPAPPRLSPAAQRDASLAASLGDFTEGGGVVRNRSELARGFGAVAGARADAAQFEADSAVEKAGLTRVRDDERARMELEKAEGLIAIEQEANTRAQDRWREHERLRREAMKSNIDPHRYWNNAGGFSKAMWITGLLASGLSGDMNSVRTTMDVLRGVIADDIGAQTADQANRRGLIQQAGEDLKAEDLQQRRYLDQLALDQQMRIDSVIKGLDARIAQVGTTSEAAQKLLTTRALLEEEAFKLQTAFQGQIQQEEEAKKTRAQQVFMENLQHRHRKELAAIDLRDKMALEDYKKAKIQEALPGVDPALGVRVFDPATGLVTRTLAQGDEKTTQKIGGVAAAANERYSALQTVKEELAKMSGTVDLARGGGAKFRNAVIALATAQAKANNPDARLSDMDFVQAAKQVLGVDVAGSLSGNVWEITKLPGDTFGQLNENLDYQLRNLSNETENNIRAIRGDLPGEVRFIPQDLRGKEPGALSEDEAAARAAGGVDTGPQRVERRAPLTLEEPPALTGNYSVTRVPDPNEGVMERDAREQREGAQAAERAVKEVVTEGERARITAKNKQKVEEYLADYADAKKEGRLPLLPPEEEEEVRAVVSEFQGRGDRAVGRLSENFWKRKDVSAEARARVIAEAALRMLDAPNEGEDDPRHGPGLESAARDVANRTGQDFNTVLRRLKAEAGLRD